MKFFYFCVLNVVVLSSLILQSCGGGKSDTNGNLTIGTPTVTDKKCGIQEVDATVTYTLPVGKTTAQGVQVVVSEFENSVLISRHTDTLTDSPTVIHSYFITQIIGQPVVVTVTATIGDMSSSVGAVVPATTFSNL